MDMEVIVKYSDKVYDIERGNEVLARGIVKGFEFCVVSYGTHPCCYVKIPENHVFYRKSWEDIELECHGGVTFASDDASFCGLGFWVGWDYAHVGDYMVSRFLCIVDNDNKKWSVDELINDVREVIEELKKGRVI